jgi:hypothetical protein
LEVLIEETSMENAMTAHDHSRRWLEAAQEDDALQRFADRYGISLNQAKNLVARFGSDRAMLDGEAAKLGGEH